MDLLDFAYKRDEKLIKYIFPHLIERIGTKNLMDFAKSPFEKLIERHSDLIDWLEEDLLSSELIREKFSDDFFNNDEFLHYIILDNFYFWLHQQLRDMNILYMNIP